MRFTQSSLVVVYWSCLFCWLSTVRDDPILLAHLVWACRPHPPALLCLLLMVPVWSSVEKLSRLLCLDDWASNEWREVHWRQVPVSFVSTDRAERNVCTLHRPWSSEEWRWTIVSSDLEAKRSKMPTKSISLTGNQHESYTTDQFSQTHC